MMYLRFLLALRPYMAAAICFLYFSHARSQTYHFDNYSVKEGLAQSSVYSMQQDEEGFIWLGTASGLSRFDGSEFVNYTTENGLADGAVKFLHIDSSGAVWSGHVDGGISKMVNGHIEVLFSMSADITSFAEDDEGNLWVSSYGEGVIKIANPYATNNDSISFRQYKGQEGLSDVVFQIVKIQNGNIYFITDVGIKSYNYQKDQFDFYKEKKLPVYFQITCMFEGSNKDQWFGSYNGGLYHYSKELGSLKIYDVRDGLGSNWISTIGEDDKGNVWVGTWGGGVSRISKAEVMTINKSNGLKDAHIRCIIKDREGNVLIGTKETGLLLYKGSQFVSYRPDNGLINEQVWAIYRDEDQKEWFGTNGGISVFKNSELVNSYSEERGMPYQQVRYIKSDRNKGIWIGTWGGGVMKYNERFDKFDMVYRVNSYMDQHLITAMDVDKENNLWVGTTDGLVYYEIDNQLVDRLTQSDGLAGNEISTIYTDSKNTVWVGSRGKGIARIDGAKIKKVELDRKITPTTIVEDKEGKLWIGTEGKGVLLFDGNKIVKEYNVNNGLLSDYISLLNMDEEGNVWIGTNRGLNKYHVAQDRFYSFSDKMGYVGIESKNNATYRDKDGNLWFGTIKGVVKLNVKDQTVNTLEPLTKISNLSVNLEDRKMVDDLELSYKEKSIVFNYSSICLTNPSKVYYKVMLQGLEEEWRPVTQQTFVTYSPLPPGKYVFKVMASNNNGIWNNEPVTYRFSIIPPIWQRPWFLIVCFILIIILVILFVKVRERKLLNEKRILEEKVEQRTQEVVKQSEEIERKNKDIIDSITYAKRIQDAILPTDEMFVTQLPNTFVFFNPKDIVSGDFYWLAKKGDKSLFAAVDCTGHGVPGAFMSIVGYNLLDKIVGEYGRTDPDEILNELNKGVANTLRQQDESEAIKDGMDISLCCFDKKTNIIEYAGAYNPLYIVSEYPLEVLDGNEVEPVMKTAEGLMMYEIKANRFPIGSYSGDANTFTKHAFKLKKGDTVYLFSDGYADQFGGEKGKKFRYRQFKELLLSINDMTMEEQKTKLRTVFDDWKGDYEQIDDIILIGSKL